MKRSNALLFPFVVLVFLAPARHSSADLCAYVANSGSDYLSVIDVAANSAAAEIGVGGSPRSVAVGPTGQFIYSVVDRRLSVIDAATYTAAREIPLPEGYPDTLVIAPDGTIAYVEDYWQNSIVFVDTRTGLSRSVPVFGDLYAAGTPVRFAVGGNGSLLYVPLPEGNARIAVVDTESAIVARVFNVLPDLELPAASAITVSPDGRTAYLLLASASVIPIIDTATEAVSSVIQTSGTSFALSQDAKRLYVTASGVLRIVDVDTQDITTVSLSEVRSPAAIAVAPTQNALLIADSGSQTVAVVDTATYLLRTQVPVGIGPRDIAIGQVAGPCRPPDYTPPPTTTATPPATATPTKVPLPQCPDGVPCLSVSSASGQPGQDVSVDVRLHTAGQTVSGTQNDILWEAGLSVHTCTVGDGSVRLSTSYEASSMRALVFSSSGGPIADGTVLYHCTVTIANDAPLGTFYLRTVGIYGSEPSGRPVSMMGTDGSIVVGGEQRQEAQQTGADGGGGCVVDGNGAPAGWLPLALAPLLWRRPARRRET